MRRVDYKSVYGEIKKRLENAYNRARSAANESDDKTLIGECSGLLMAQIITFDAWKKEVVKDD